jgi:hypothetical protein
MQISIPRRQVMARTVPESAGILGYAARGYVDEVFERLLQASLENRPGGFGNELLDMARRGHTSGVDMSLGVLLCEAAVSDSDGRPALEGCLRVLLNT